ncbi:hypothetical protein [Pedobacter sp. B4-66]|uniref:hypothetical protein n=1 Tax=Pedobacter sp. B4-66 TaxID=2817280 RepID=UPI001BD9BFAF|nr:hypothetical protein [Pedobacter sp. B4-66]
MKILILLPVDSQPRFIKRINLLKDEHEVTVAYQQRDYFKKNSIPDGCKKVILGKVENKKYHKRIFKIFNYYSKIKGLNEKFDVIYAFSFDLLIISMFFKCKFRIYEIGDLRRVKLKIFDVLNKYLLSKQDQIIVTSYKFGQYLNEKYDVQPSKIKVLENKLEYKSFKDITPGLIKSSNKIKIGVIGLLRYQQILDLLDAVAQSPERFEIHIYGSGTLLNRILPFIDNKTFFYYGEFKYPNDLEAIYADIDFNFVMYDSTDLNVRLALPNKLYESIYFNVPIIVSSNTYLSEKVLEYGVGISWDINNISKLPGNLIELASTTKYQELIDSCKKLDRENIFLNEADYSIL